ncbi:D-alanyl-D-alanine carboxypeptidase [Nocardioides zeae]|uniref:D-alanyl-D-alanine carboxypeptidase n=1 Tax=Nocardioides zeae TaxID=1457234 RepID=A0ACC6IJF6_9ACTN|nr:serine hydrolase domain-containing protein [Nocardioides zeae]MDR6174734.1 D-alanyl-D-alanine carboxypeptidase [Nocardioides zeae]MDR6210803.1 D-alanyl-D-alanine carboxypeptidase [Nocardioides zeae]
MSTTTTTARRTARSAAALASAAVLSLVAPVAAQASPGAADPLPYDTAALEAAMAAAVEVEHVAVVGEVRGERGRWSGADGVRDLASSEPALARDRFRSASTTKMLVAVLALKAQERGLWRLDTTVDDVAPGLLGEHGDVTVRELLSHTSGLPEYLGPLLVAESGDDHSTGRFLEVVGEPRDPEQLVAYGAGAPWTPRGEFVYSNTGFVVVGELLQRVTGQRLDDLLRSWVLGPAGMWRTSLPDDPRLPADALTEYATMYGERVDLSAFDPTLFGAAGGLVTTTEDLNRFQRALGSGRLLGAGSVRLMREVVSTEPLAYGLGSYRLPDPCEPGSHLHGHDGASYGTWTVSYASADGQRAVTLAVTGRDLDTLTPDLSAFNALVGEALAQTCAGEPVQPGARSAAPVAPVHDLVDRTPLPPRR